MNLNLLATPNPWGLTLEQHKKLLVHRLRAVADAVDAGDADLNTVTLEMDGFSWWKGTMTFSLPLTGLFSPLGELPSDTGGTQP
jgi:hypothetical protein